MKETVLTAQSLGATARGTLFRYTNDIWFIGTFINYETHCPIENLGAFRSYQNRYVQFIGGKMYPKIIHYDRL